MAFISKDTYASDIHIHAWTLKSKVLQQSFVLYSVVIVFYVPVNAFHLDLNACELWRKLVYLVKAPTFGQQTEKLYHNVICPDNVCRHIQVWPSVAKSYWKFRNHQILRTEWIIQVLINNQGIIGPSRC